MPLALSAPRSVLPRSAAQRERALGADRVSTSIAAAAHTATSLRTPALDGATWTRVQHCTGTAEAHEEWRLAVDLAQLKPDQVAQLSTPWERLVGLSQPVCLYPGSNKL